MKEMAGRDLKKIFAVLTTKVLMSNSRQLFNFSKESSDSEDLPTPLRITSSKRIKTKLYSSSTVSTPPARSVGTPNSLQSDATLPLEGSEQVSHLFSKLLHKLRIITTVSVLTKLCLKNQLDG